MILLTGSTGYIGSEFKKQLEKKGLIYCTVSHKEINKKNLKSIIKYKNITHIINCAAFVGKPNIEQCEKEKEKSINGNILVPFILKEIAEDFEIAMCHISTGCIYNGLSPNFLGWNETNEPNLSFELNNCSFYTGTKLSAENIIKNYEKSYIWRIRLPFENKHNQRNYISKIINYENLLLEKNSISHKEEFVSACIQSIELNIPFGTYNITNTGSISAYEIFEKLKKTIAPNKEAKFLSIDDFYKKISSMPRSNCVLDNSKILATGIKLTEVNELVDKCIKEWKW
jgi:UDP-glucose 4,6-dehydratase